MVMARDGFSSVAGNLRSLAMAIEGLRQLERHGGSLVLERAFEGFRAIAPPGSPGAKCWTSSPIGPALYRAKARTLASRRRRQRHAHGRTQCAYEGARLELGV
jgi:hypothetical protein